MLTLLFVVPIGLMLVLSVTDPRLSLAHYQRIFTVPLYTQVMLNTFVTSLIVTALCLVLGYPVAYVMARRDRLGVDAAADHRGHELLDGLSGPDLRLAGDPRQQGARGRRLRCARAGRPPPKLLFTSFASTMGMTHILLPFMILALYAVMKKIEPDHLKAAASLGARPRAAFTEVFLPLSLPGVVNGSLLVFVICLGFFVTPILLGTPRDMMISQLINQQIEELLAWGFASAVAVILLVATGLILAVYNRFAGLDRLWG